MLFIEQTVFVSQYLFFSVLFLAFGHLYIYMLFWKKKTLYLLLIVFILGIDCYSTVNVGAFIGGHWTL